MGRRYVLAYAAQNPINDLTCCEISPGTDFITVRVLYIETQKPRLYIEWPTFTSSQAV